VPEQKKAFAVSKGEYSDYGVIAIFDTRTRAEQYLRNEGLIRSRNSRGLEFWNAAGNADYGDYRIEEFDYYDDDVLPLSAVTANR
jgi:hypothetical protein